MFKEFILLAALGATPSDVTIGESVTVNPNTAQMFVNIDTDILMLCVELAYKPGAIWCWQVPTNQVIQVENTNK